MFIVNAEGVSNTNDDGGAVKLVDGTGTAPTRLAKRLVNGRSNS
ncbi:MAG: hypothetical protein WAN47_07205 [Nitrosotalea sp.]